LPGGLSRKFISEAAEALGEAVSEILTADVEQEVVPEIEEQVPCLKWCLDGTDADDVDEDPTTTTTTVEGKEATLSTKGSPNVARVKSRTKKKIAKRRTRADSSSSSNSSDESESRKDSSRVSSRLDVYPSAVNDRPSKRPVPDDDENEMNMNQRPASPNVRIDEEQSNNADEDELKNAAASKPASSVNTDDEEMPQSDGDGKGEDEDDLMERPIKIKTRVKKPSKEHSRKETVPTKVYNASIRKKRVVLVMSDSDDDVNPLPSIVGDVATPPASKKSRMVVDSDDE